MSSDLSSAYLRGVAQTVSRERADLWVVSEGVAAALRKIWPLLQLGPIRLARRARRRELRRYIRQQASERRLRRNRAVIDETHLWRGQQ